MRRGIVRGEEAADLVRVRVRVRVRAKVRVRVGVTRSSALWKVSRRT